MATDILNDVPAEIPGLPNAVSLPRNVVGNAHGKLLWTAEYARAIEGFAAELIEADGAEADPRVVAIKATSAHIAATVQAIADRTEI